MFDQRYFHILISAILFKNSYQHLLSFAEFPEERIEPAECGTSPDGTSLCVNCVTSRFCFSSAAFDTNCTGSTPYCGFDTSSIPSQYTCVASNVDCECPGTLELTYIPDPFNSHFYATCYGTDRITVDCGANFYNPETNDCSATTSPPPPTPRPPTTTPPPPTTPTPLCPEAGTFEDDDPTTCDGFVLCSSSGEVVTSGKCTPPNSYFNPIISNCDSPIPPFSCPPNQFGYYGDPFDCKRYYLCNGNTLIAAECCPTGTFDISSTDNPPCSTSMTPPCVAALPCAREETTTAMSTLTSQSASASSSSSTEPSVPASSSSSTEPSASASSSTSTEPSVPVSSSSSTEASASASSSSSTEPSVSASSSSSTEASASASSSSSTEASASASSIISTTTTSTGPFCIPLSSFTCPEPDGYFPQCNYCARTYFQCISATATLRTCTGNGVFNTVPSYPACLSPEYCPYYP